MKPGILSKSMENVRSKIFPVKEFTPVVTRANDNTRVESERTKDLLIKEPGPIFVRRATNCNIARMDGEKTKDSLVKEPPPVVRRLSINSASKEVC